MEIREELRQSLRPELVARPAPLIEADVLNIYTRV
jgi:hypothetical protein